MPTTFWARVDSNTANNSSLNLTGDDAVEITFVPSGTDGDVILEGGVADPDTEVQIAGVSYSFTFEFSATTPTLANQGAGKYPPELQGTEVIVITVFDYPTVGETTRLVFFPDANPTQALVDSIGNGANAPQNIDTTGPGVICFGEGTLLATPDGPRAVEALKVGDLVETVDAGPMPIIWASCTHLTWPGASENSRPILISAGALGDGMPDRDLVVSPQHKVLLCLPSGEEGMSKTEYLAPAKGLTGLPGIRLMRGKRRTTYYHIMLERHAILFSEQLRTESFFPGPTALRMLRAEQQLRLFASLSARDGVHGYGPQARPSLTYRQTVELASRLRRGIVPERRVSAQVSSIRP